LKKGHALTAQYLEWTKNRPDAECWRCRYRCQTREHHFKNYPEWKEEQRALRAAVRKETGEGRIDSGSGTSSSTKVAARRAWISMRPPKLEGECRDRLRKLWKARIRVGTAGAGRVGGGQEASG
jgi:hypothetical protein